jgi:predicted phospho-2-dehydro-3-deoxyheptonate aldolase
MTDNKKDIRLQRISHKNRFVIVPMDHGVSSGPIKGLIDIGTTIEEVKKGGASAVVLHKGIAPYGLGAVGGNIGFILHLSASTKLAPDPNAKVLVSSPSEAQEMGADCVSIHVNVGAKTESNMLSDLGFVSSECRKFGIPLLAMMYPRGPEIKDPFNVDLVKHVARLGCELGADIIKTNYTGSPDTFQEVVKGCPQPVVIAGGPKVDSDNAVLQMVYDAMAAGASGISIGRNIFQHDNVRGITKAIAKIVCEKIEVEEALKEIVR